jgi:biotin transport system substrate-specific component
MSIKSHNRVIIFISFFTALTAIGAFIKIPLPQVPITLQTFFVMMSGNMLGYKFGSFSQILYLTLGLIGIPIFAFGGGPGYVLQPTFGYLLGYPAGAFTIGILLKLFRSRLQKIDIQKRKLFFIYFLADVSGVIIIFIFGLLYLFINLKLGLYLRLEQFAAIPIDWLDSLKAVLFVFIPIDLVKACLASWVTRHLRKLSQNNYLIERT